MVHLEHDDSRRVHNVMNLYRNNEEAEAYPDDEVQL